MRDASLERWEKVTHISIGFAWAVAALFGIAGYATFRALSQGKWIEGDRGENETNRLENRRLFSVASEQWIRSMERALPRLLSM